MRDSSRR